MVIKPQMPTSTLTAVLALLQPYVPDVSPKTLVSAIREYEPNREEKAVVEKPLTRKEAAEILSVSTATISNYIKSGYLKSVQMGRLVRIAPASVRQILDVKA